MTANRYYTSDAVPTTLAAGLPAVAAGTTGIVQVASITGYPVSFPFTLLLDWGTAAQEVVTVTQAATGGGPYTYANCVRGDDGSTPAGAPAHALGATVVHGASARDYAEPQTHLGSATGVHGVAGGLAAAADLTAETARAETAEALAGPKLTQAAVLTASGTAAANTVVPVNTTSGNVTVTLPSAPPAGTLVAVKHIIQGGTNTVTVACGGSDVLNKAGGGTSLTLPLASQGVLLAYGAGIWVNLADDLPLAQLDTRYANLASPALTGTPTAPTATALTSTTQLATTAFVGGAVTAAEALALALTGGTVAGNVAVKGGRPWYDVIAFGADPTGVADSTAAIQAAINAATGAASPQTASRTPTGPVYIPAGSYLITSDISILSVDGFHLLGAGADMVMLLAKGAAWTAAVININGAANCTFEGFSIQSTGAAPANQFPVGVNVTWTGPYNATTNPAGVARSTTGTTLRNMRVRGNFVTGVSLAGVGTYQLDGEVLEDVIVSGGQSGVNGGGWSNTGLWQNGFIFGNDGWGNIYDQVLRNCGAVSCYYGYYCNASGFALYGAQPGNNGIDFYIYPGAQCTISNVQSQNSGQFISAPAGFSPKPVGVSDCQVVSLAVTTPDVISIPGGQWDIRNFSAIAYSSSGSNVAPVINITGGGVSRQATVTLTNVIMSSTFPAAVSASNAYVTVNNYAYFNPVANTVTGYPPMFYPNSSWQTMLAGFSATAALAFTSPIASGATASLTMTVTGATAGQAVSLGVPATFPAGCVAQGFVSAANTVTVVIANLSGAAVTPGTITVTAEVH